MTCNIVSPETLVSFEDVKYVQLPGTQGCFGILPRHAHLISSLEQGTMRITQADKSNKFFLLQSGGFVEVKNDVISIVAESITEIAK